SRPLIRLLATIITLMAKPPARPARAPPVMQRSPSLGLRIIGKYLRDRRSIGRAWHIDCTALGPAMDLIEEIADELGCERGEAERLAVAVIATIEERM